MTSRRATTVRLSVARAVAVGALAVGVLDGVDALVFFGLRGVAPERIFQAVAAGVLGRAAFAGGAATVALGVALHFVVATGIVATYVLASRRLEALRRRPLVWGPLYGVAAYFVMRWVVIPLSAATAAPVSWPVLVNGLLVHALGVGLPAALAAARVGPPRP